MLRSLIAHFGLLLLFLPAKNWVNYENRLTRLSIIKIWQCEFEFWNLFEILIIECWYLAFLLLEFKLSLDSGEFTCFFLEVMCELGIVKCTSKPFLDGVSDL